MTQEPQKIQLVLPWWCATIAGFIIIAAVALGAMAIVQARIIDSQTVKLNQLYDTIDTLSSRIEEFNKDRAVLRELQDWRVGVTIASRSGWTAANRYIQENPLPMPDEDYTATAKGQ